MNSNERDQNMNSINQVIAERAYQAIKDITPQMEQDIRNEIRMRYEEELLQYKNQMEDKIKQSCSKEIEERVELMHKQTIEEYKRRKKNIEMKERELEEHRKRLEMLYEPEVQQREEQNFKVEKERIMTELLQNIDKNQLVNEVETELKKEIQKELSTEREGEIKRKDTIMRLNFKKKFESEKTHIEEQIKSSSENELQMELENIQLQRQLIESQTQEKHNRIQNLQNEKKQQKLMLQKQKESFQSMITNLEKEIENLQKQRSQISIDYASSSSSTFRKGNSSRHASPQQTSKIITSVVQPPLTSVSSQQIQSTPNLPIQTSPTIPVTSQRSGRKGQSIQFQNEQEQLSQSSKVASPNNRLQNGYTSSQSSINQQKSREEMLSQQAQNYLSEHINTVVDDHPQNQPYHKLDTFNPSEAHQFTEGDRQDKYEQYRSNEDQIQEHQPLSTLLFHNQLCLKYLQSIIVSDVKDRVTNLLGQIQEKYTTELKEDVQNFIIQAEINAANKQRFQSLPVYLKNNNTDPYRVQTEGQEPIQENEFVQAQQQIQKYKPSLHLLRKDSSETESLNDQQSINEYSEQKQQKKEKSYLNQETQRNLREQYEQIKKINEQQQMQGGRTFKTETNSVRYNTVGNEGGGYQNNIDYMNNNYITIETDPGKRSNVLKYNNLLDGEDHIYTSNQKRTLQSVQNPNQGWYTSQGEDLQTEEDVNEESILNSSSSTVQLQKELRNPERVRPKEIQTEEEMVNYILQEKSFPSKKQYFLLWKVRPRDSDEDKAIKNIKLTIDFILEEEKEYEPIFEQKVKHFEKDLELTIRKFSEDSWTEDDTKQKVDSIQEKFNKLKYFWRICDYSFKDRIQVISTITALSCMLNKMERQIEDQVEIMDIVRNNPIVLKIGQQLKERQKIREKMINDFCLMNYRNSKEDLKIIYEQINMLNNEYQQTDKKGKKSTGARLSRNKNNPKVLFWRNIKISDILRVDKWEEQKLQQCLIKLKLQGIK